MTNATINRLYWAKTALYGRIERGEKMKMYKLVNYFDVWENETGWQVNNQCIEEENIYISDDASEQDIIDFLYNIEFFITNDIEKFYIEMYNTDFIEIYAKDMCPLCRLEKM